MKLMNYFNNKKMVVYVLSVPRVTFRTNERVEDMI